MKNLDDSIDDEKLRKEFSPYGVITSAKVRAGGTHGGSVAFPSHPHCPRAPPSPPRGFQGFGAALLLLEFGSWV